MSKDDYSLPSAPAADAPSTTYKASCHCGTFAYNVKASPPLSDPGTTVMQCNCSICERNGYLFIYVPDERISFTKGKFEDFGTYSFASKKMAHCFCPTCGSSCMARSQDPEFFPGMTCVNVRMLEGLDLKKLAFKEADGKSYVAPAAA